MAKHSSNKAPVRQQRNGRAQESLVPERRASDRVDDDQKSGNGSMSALSKLRMIERQRAAMRPSDEES